MSLIKFPFDEVPGLLSPTDRHTLMELSDACSPLEGQYVEIGSWIGASALCILEGMPMEKSLWAFDFFYELQRFDEHLISAGFSNRTIVCKGDFRQTWPVVESNLKQVAFAFVDHDHAIATTETAYMFLWPRLVSRGILAFHDYGHSDYPQATEYLGALSHRLSINEGIISFQKP